MLENKENKAEDWIERSILNLMEDGEKWKLKWLEDRINSGLHPDEWVLKIESYKIINT